jgi:hypothetical protein
MTDTFGTKPPERPGLIRPLPVEKEPMLDHPTTLTRAPTCQECCREWNDPHERWRLYVVPDEPAETLIYCPVCAIREFGD